MIRAERTHHNPELLGEQLAQQLLDQGAGVILGLEEKRA
jgi:hypothetical protein